MPTIPLGIGAYKRDAGFQEPVVLHNMYMEKDDSGASPDKYMRVQRPGLSTFATVGGAINGLFYQQALFNDDRFAIGGDTLYRVDAGGAVSNQGTVTGDGLASFAPSVNRIGIARYPNAYIYNGTLAALAIPTGLPVIDMDQLNGYLIFLTPTGRFYWLVPGEATIDALNFANAESSPDGGVAVKRLVDELFFFGTTTVEVWQTTGNLDAPFQRAAGRIYDKGCLNKDTVQRFDNALIWVGDDLSVYRASQVPQDIGSPFITERLRKRTDDPTAMVVTVDDHSFYVLRIPGQGSFAYDASTQLWCEWGTSGLDTFSAHLSIEELRLIGDSATGAIWFMDPELGTDAGVPIIRRVTGAIPAPSRPIPSSNFSAGIGCSADTTVKIRWKDGRDAWPAYYEEMEAPAPYDVVNIYRTGQMRDPVRVWEVMFDGPERVRLSGAAFGEAWQ